MICSKAGEISGGERVAKKPKRPVLIPKIGISEAPICVSVSSNVPSPPMLKAISVPAGIPPASR